MIAHAKPQTQPLRPFPRQAKMDKDWSKEERRDKRMENWNSFEKAGGIKKKVSGFKQQERGDSKKPKFGAHEHEEWRKNWK